MPRRGGGPGLRASAQYTGPMVLHDASNIRLIDEAAVITAQRRLARSKHPPWLHLEIARRMAERLLLFKSRPAQVVDWWSFSGGGSELLRATYPEARVCAVEPNAASAARSRAQLIPPWWSPKRWVAGSGTVVQSDEELPVGVNLIWANMVLHAVLDPPMLMSQWHRMLEPGGFLMFSALGPDTLRELTALNARERLGPATIEFVDMHDLGDMLLQAGFSDPVMDQERLTIRWDTPQALLADLRAIGANVSPVRFQGLRTPHWLDELHHRLDGLRNDRGQLELSFEIVYGHAFKVAPAVALPVQTEVSLDSMRALVRSARQSA